MAVKNFLRRRRRPPALRSFGRLAARQPAEGRPAAEEPCRQGRWRPGRQPDSWWKFCPTPRPKSSSEKSSRLEESLGALPDAGGSGRPRRRVVRGPGLRLIARPSLLPHRARRRPPADSCRQRFCPPGLLPHRSEPPPRSCRQRRRLGAGRRTLGMSWKVVCPTRIWRKGSSRRSVRMERFRRQSGLLRGHRQLPARGRREPGLRLAGLAGRRPPALAVARRRAGLRREELRKPGLAGRRRPVEEEARRRRGRSLPSPTPFLAESKPAPTTE